MSNELPESVLEAISFWKERSSLKDCLKDILGGEEMVGFDLEYDDLFVDGEEDGEDPGFAEVSIFKLIVWSKTKILIWEPEWRYFRVYPRNPDAKNKFKSKRE
jgi:hypothetical protein